MKRTINVTMKTIRTIITIGFILLCISNEYVQYDDSYIDMNTLIGFNNTEYGLMFYFNDVTGYYWEW